VEEALAFNDSDKIYEAFKEKYETRAVIFKQIVNNYLIRPEHKLIFFAFYLEAGLNKLLDQHIKDKTPSIQKTDGLKEEKLLNEKTTVVSKNTQSNKFFQAPQAAIFKDGENDALETQVNTEENWVNTSQFIQSH
jgi:hypothetical protein